MDAVSRKAGMREMPAGFQARWQCYLRERFPLGQHGVLIGIFALAVTAYARALEGAPGWPPVPGLAVGFIDALLLFLQLRILDEFKDFAEDARYRPDRPVPRGVVSLRALGWLGAIAALVQLVLAATLGRASLATLLLAWGYALLMAREFFVRRWLKARPVAYMASHMVVVPLIVLHVAACASGAWPERGIAWLGAASYASFCVFEIGRKIRAPADEREGVEMYSALWGTRRAVAAWLAVLLAASVLETLAAARVGAALVMATTATAVAILSAAMAARFLAALRPGGGRVFLLLSAAWLFAAHAVLAATCILARP